MWAFVFAFLTVALLFYLYFVKRELRKLRQQVKEIRDTFQFWQSVIV